MSKRNLAVNVEFLTRVEGHGHIVVDMAEGVLKSCQLQIVEAPRFFEAMLKGRSLFEAQHIVSRICGICACGHSLASIQAAEDAIGLVPSEQTLLLRRLLLHMENLDSHILHIYLLAAPDLLGAQSFVQLLGSHQQEVCRALRMKKLCNDVCGILAGRHIHPIATVVGGFTRLPRVADLEAMRAMLVELERELEPTVELVSSLPFPDFERQTEYVALVGKDGGYPMLSGEIGSSDGVRKKKEDYRVITNEFVVPHSSAKHARLSRSSYAVGALARFNLNHGGLSAGAKQAAEAVGLQAPCCNPFLNTVAQLVESVHCCEEAIKVIDTLSERGVDLSQEVTGGTGETGAIEVKAGIGVGAVEVPRGLLFHRYRVDERGIITEADCVIPTGQNLQNIEDDMRQLVPQIVDRSDKEITLALEMLVRAYDPCISCSTHMLKVDLVNRPTPPG